MLDVVNIMFVLTIFLIIQKYYQIKLVYIFILLGHLFLIFFYNGFLFQPSFMPDQFKYLEIAQNIREFHFIDETNFNSGTTVFFSGVFFGLFPIPFIDSLYSIGMINFLLYFYIFIYMHKKGFLSSKFIVWFYLLYPSLIVYSSVALRDMLIFFIMFFASYYILIINKKIIGFCIISSLLYTKFQNFIIYTFAFVLSIILTKQMNKYYLLFGVLFFFFFLDFISIEKLNFYRFAFYTENLLTIEQPFVAIDSYFDLILSAIPSIMKFMFRPLPWEEFGLLQTLQFIENCCIVVIVLYILKQNGKCRLWIKQEVIFLNIFFFLALLVYGLVIYNSGTAVRYKFPFVTIYIIYSWYFIYQSKQLFKKSDICVE